MNDPITIERSVLVDLLSCLRIFGEIMLERQKVHPLTDDERERLVYVEKCMDQCIESYSKSNP